MQKTKLQKLIYVLHSRLNTRYYFITLLETLTPLRIAGSLGAIIHFLFLFCCCAVVSIRMGEYRTPPPYSPHDDQPTAYPRQQSTVVIKKASTRGRCTYYVSRGGA